MSIGGVTCSDFGRFMPGPWPLPASAFERSTVFRSLLLPAAWFEDSFAR